MKNKLILFILFMLVGAPAFGQSLIEISGTALYEDNCIFNADTDANRGGAVTVDIYIKDQLGHARIIFNLDPDTMTVVACSLGLVLTAVNVGTAYMGIFDTQDTNWVENSLDIATGNACWDSLADGIEWTNAAAPGATGAGYSEDVNDLAILDSVTIGNVGDTLWFANIPADTVQAYLEGSFNFTLFSKAAAGAFYHHSSEAGANEPMWRMWYDVVSVDVYEPPLKYPVWEGSVTPLVKDGSKAPYVKP